MEKLLTTEERIRRAEEIYERRRNPQTRLNTATVPVNERKNFKLFKKLILQILACGVIYFLFSWFQTTPYFSLQEEEGILKKFFSYDTNFQNIWENIQSEMVKFQGEEENKQEENQTLQEATLSITDTVDFSEETKQEESLSQMEQDAVFIKENYSVIKPIEGKISSEFGQRESTSSIVSNYHLGIDVSAVEGTKIKAAMEGTVTIAKNSSSYRELYKNRKWRSLYDLCAL